MGFRSSEKVTQEVCPNGCDLRGVEIPEEYLREGYYGPWEGEKRYYSRMIGYEIQGLYDGVAFWMCPDCGIRWHRFPETWDIRKKVEAYWKGLDNE